MDLRFPQKLEDKFTFKELSETIRTIENKVKDENYGSEEIKQMFDAVVCIGIYAGYLRRTGKSEVVGEPGIFRDLNTDVGILLLDLNSRKPNDYNPYTDSDIVKNLKQEWDEYLRRN